MLHMEVLNLFLVTCCQRSRKYEYDHFFSLVIIKLKHIKEFLKKNRNGKKYISVGKA